MNTYKKAVKDLCDEIYKFGVQQITIDLVQDNIEELLNQEEEVTRDDVGAAAYDCSILHEVFDPKFEKDIRLLFRLKAALNAWETDIERNNGLLGLPIET